MRDIHWKATGDERGGTVCCFFHLFVLRIIKSKCREDVIGGSCGVIRMIAMKKKVAIPANYNFCEVRGHRICGVLLEVMFEDVYSFMFRRETFTNVDGRCVVLDKMQDIAG